MLALHNKQIYHRSTLVIEIYQPEVIYTPWRAAEWNIMLPRVNKPNNRCLTIAYLFYYVKMSDICNLIGQNSVHISDTFIFAVKISMEYIARKIEVGKK